MVPPGFVMWNQALPDADRSMVPATFYNACPIKKSSFCPIAFPRKIIYNVKVEPRMNQICLPPGKAGLFI
jgi:hypothetical protein